MKSECSEKCPDQPHYHIDDSGPLCGGDYKDKHPDWCVGKHYIVKRGAKARYVS